ncbi:MAG: signal peptide peptidase SppA [Crocinitomicaceae bacterium]
MNMTFWKTFWASLLGSLVSGLIIVGIFFLILRIMISGFALMLEPKKLVVEENTVLHMELNDPLGDYTKASFDPSTFQMNKQFGLMEILDGIETAKNDDKIKGIFLHCDEVAGGMATVKEVRDALQDFQESGKFVVSYHENYSAKAYYLSSVADELYVFPSGMITWLGLGSEIMFLKGALEKLDVEMQIIRGSNNKFKSAVEPLLYTEMSEANRLQTEKFLGSLWDEMVNAVASSRNMKPGYLNKIADSVLVRQSGDAVNHKMADDALYYDEVLDILKVKADSSENAELKLLSFKKYALKKTKEERNLAKLEPKNLAVIFAEGEIVDGNGSQTQIGGTSLSKMIREAREDSTIKAVVLRVDSPGGSALASDIIWREVVLTREAGKPVVVSMGDVAASGGYYISCAADKIYAQPNTITGSIGVFGIIPYTGKMFENKLGITFDRVQTNDHAILSTNRKLDEQELAIVQEGVDIIYDDFISKVAEGRGMKKAMVDSIGQGRVWAGVDAKEIGLIDEYGGIYDAIYYAADQANISKDSIGIRFFPSADENKLFDFIENIEDAGEQTSIQPSRLELQIREIYNYARTVGSQSTIQARMPYLMWIE